LIIQKETFRITIPLSTERKPLGYLIPLFISDKDMDGETPGRIYLL
jgi:hypothetical protein